MKSKAGEKGAVELLQDDLMNLVEYMPSLKKR